MTTLHETRLDPRQTGPHITFQTPAPRPLQDHSVPFAEGVTARAVHVITWGCQMNVYDSQRMEDVLNPLGYRAVDAPEQADLIILNTCHIRERATEKLFSELGRLNVLQRQRASVGGRLMVAVAGCVAQAEGAVILDRAPYVDLVFGPQTYHRLPEMLRRAAAGVRVIETDFPAEDKFDYLPDEAAPRRGGSLTAFLSIQEGCDKFCSFCVVPYTRGAEVSRPAAAILAEARRLVERGAREITLLGQNVNAWHGQGLTGRDWGLGRLLAALAELPGLDRLRYTTSHPRDMDDALIAAHRDIPAVMPFLHLPVQSGSDRILAAMNRKHTAAEYLRLTDRLRTARPDLALSSDFIVGFPGESVAEFEATLTLIRRAGFMQAYSFAYSPRPGTAAAAMADQVPASEQAVRLQALQSLLAEQQVAFNTACLDRTLDVLFTGPGRRPGQMSGRTPYLQPVHVIAGAEVIGRIVPVRIEDARPNSLGGRLDVPPISSSRLKEPVCV